MFFGALAGGTGASLGGGNFWQGAVTGLVVSGLNHTMHNVARHIQEGIILDDFAKSKYGDDYKKVYGVRSLKWASEIKASGAMTKKGYLTYNKESKFLTLNGETLGGITMNRHIYISDYFRSGIDNIGLEGVLGHEFVHSSDELKFGRQYNAANSEFNAYQFSIDYSAKYDPSRVDYFKTQQSLQGIENKLYNYKILPLLKN